jgi:hypothetical protein
VSLKGIIENTGVNYFTHLSLTLTDQTGRSIPIKIDAPTELPPTPVGHAASPHPSPVSDYLNRTVRATGTIVSTDVPGKGKFYVLHVTDVSPAAAH